MINVEQGQQIIKKIRRYRRGKGESVKKVRKPADFLSIGHRKPEKRTT